MRRRQRKATPPFPPYFVFTCTVEITQLNDNPSPQQRLAFGRKYFAGNQIPEKYFVQRFGDAMWFHIPSDEGTVIFSIYSGCLEFVDHEGVRHDV